MNDQQRQIYDTCHNESGKMFLSPKILKTRQIGITTLFALSYLDDAIWNKNINAYIQSHYNNSIEKIFRIVRYAYDNMISALKPQLDRGGGSKYELFFPEINSRIYVGLENRSSTVHRLHFSELAFQDKDKVAATMGAFPKHLKYSAETTPNGMNWFHDDWQAAGQYHTKFFFPWFRYKDYAIEGINTGAYDDEERLLADRYKLTRPQIEFRRYKIAQTDKRMFLQEFAEDEQTCFMMSGNPVLDVVAVEKHRAKSKEFSLEHGCKIYIPFQKGEIYVCGSDTAEGNLKGSSDWSVSTILNSKRQQCAILRVKCKPSDFAHKTVKLCEMYSDGKKNWPILAVERNNHGHAVLQELEEHIMYPNLYYHTDEKRGWPTDRVTRPITIDTFVYAVENHSVEINDKDTLDELLTLVDNNGKIEASTGQHDDCIMSSAIALQMLVEASRQTALDDPYKAIMTR
jgi:phage terminase large subunit-like protein